MINITTKRFILPFTSNKNKEPFTAELEAAAVYALAELERGKGGGLIIKQPEEKLLFITKTGYPLWLFPNNAETLIFNGLDNSSYSIAYIELPTAQTFLEGLEKNASIRQDYFTFLLDYHSYFQQPKKEKSLQLRGLVADLELKKEFINYRKEAVEITGQPPILTLISPTLGQAVISSMISELDKVQSSLKEDAQRLTECLRLVNKTTGQHITEIDYAAEAVRDEFNAKIKAQEELVNPQVAKLNSDYKHRISAMTKGFEDELENLEELRIKTVKFMEKAEAEIKLYHKQAERQAKKEHLIYEKRWKEKSAKTKKELSGLKKELKRIEKNVKTLNKQKTTQTFKLQAELEAEIKLARQPLLDLQRAQDAKTLAFKHETEKLFEQEKPVIDAIKDSIKLREAVNAEFEALGIEGQRLDSPALFYVPFYLVCYQTGLTTRYVLIPPSNTNAISVAGKLRSALGRQKIREYFIPRFTAIAALIEKAQEQAKHDFLLDNQIRGLGEKNNILDNPSVRDSIAKGLAYLKQEGWLSEKDAQDLSNRLQSR